MDTLSTFPDVDFASGKQSSTTLARGKIAHRNASKLTKPGRHFRQDHSYALIPVEIVHKICMTAGRNKYRAIIIMVWLSMYWDGWKSRKKRKKGRLPRKESMITRRMMADTFGYAESTIKHGLKDLLSYGFTTIARGHKYTGTHGMNLGRSYRCPWMEDKRGKHKICIYWGLVSSDAFLALDVTSQAFLIVLHCIHSRKKNLVQIAPRKLATFGISRRIITTHIKCLAESGLLVLEDAGIYSFAWLQEGGQYKNNWPSRS